MAARIDVGSTDRLSGPMPDTLHTVWSTGALLGIRCHGCDHRAVLGVAELPTIRRGITTRLRDLKLRCGHCAIRGQAPESFGLYLPSDREDADSFMRGAEVRVAVVIAQRAIPGL